MILYNIPELQDKKEIKLKFASNMLNLIKCLLFWILQNHWGL